MYTIDTKSNPDYFIILKENGEELCKVSKRGNTVDKIKMMIGAMYIKEVI